MSEGESERSGVACTDTCGPYMCELEHGHSGPHRVVYAKKRDKIWDDGDVHPRLVDTESDH